MVFPGFQIQQKLHDHGLFRATSLSDASPVLLKRLAGDGADVRIFKRNKNDYLVSVGLDGEGSCVLQPLEYNDSVESAYIAYDYFDGVPLSSLIEKAPVSPVDAIRIALNLLEALDAIHRSGVAHRNLSSRCILIEPKTYEVKLLDFRFSGPSRPVLDSMCEWDPSELSLEYVSPEMTGRVGSEIDYRTDYYSFGALLYEMTCGRLPFCATHSLELMHAHIARQPAPPVTIDPANCPGPLSAVIMKLMAKMPANRYQSIAGLRNDLKRCLASLEKGDVIEPFLIGESDFSTRLSIPPELFGRAKEIAQLEDCVDRLLEGEGSFVAVHGMSGVGKTTLVKFVANNRVGETLFLTGKYEQYDTLLPYSAFARIIEMLVSTLLSEDKTTFERSKCRIETALGTHAATIVDLFPAFRSLVGAREKPLSLGVSETKNRLKMAVGALFDAVGSKDRPLALIFDDLQWVDHASLSLLASLIDDNLLHRTLVIGCYRDAETEANADLRLLLEKLKSRHQSVDIEVGNLKREDVAKLLETTFGMPKKENRALADHVYQLCHGNPFYIRQYLGNLHQDGVIRADPEKRKWLWFPRENGFDLDSSSVIEMIEESLSNLTKDQMDVLKYAIFLGSHFKLRDLSLILERAEEEIVRTLSPLIAEGLLVSNGEVVRFKHDRVQQAIASFMGNAEAKSVSLKMGIRLNGSLRDAEKDARLFEIANYYIRGEEFLEETADFEKLVELLRLSGGKALENSAYSLAFAYAEKSAALLEKSGSRFRDDNEFEIRILLGRCQYLAGRHDEAEATVDLVFNQAKNFEEQCRCYSVFKDILVSEVGDYDRAVAIGMQVLKREMPDFVDLFCEEEMDTRLQLLKDRIEELGEGRAPRELIDLPPMNNSEVARLIGLLVDLWEAAYYAANERLITFCARQSLALSLEYGNCSESAFSYVLYGMDLVSEGRYKEGYEYGRLALDLNEKYHDKVMLPKVTNLFCNYINFYIKPFRSSVSLYENSSSVGRENGDYLFGLWATFFVIWSRFLSGQPLHEIAVRAGSFQDFVSQTKDSKMIYAYRMLVDVIDSLQDEAREADPAEFCEHEASVAYWKENGFAPGIAWRAILMGQYFCLMRDYRQAYRLLADPELKMSPWIVMFPFSQHGFYFALSAMKLIQEGEIECSSELLEKIEAIIDQIAKWSELCPDNFLYQKRLLEAERYSLRGDLWAAGAAYSEAFEVAELNKLRPAAGLCCEMAADFWEKAGNQSLSDYWSRRALDSYSIWGAGRKAAEIEQRLALREAKRMTPKLAQTVEEDPKAGYGRFGSKSLDIQSVLRFTRAISEEIDDEKLFKKTMEIVMENAGADKGAILVVENDGLRVRAVGEIGESIQIDSMNVSLDEYAGLPRRVIYYVERTKELIIVDDAMTSDAVRYSAYLKNKKSHSVLCMPIIYKDEMRAILYLENASTSATFSAERAETLRVLLIQAAISKQNADLYRALESELNARRKTEEQLRKSEDRLRMSHEYASIAVWEWDIATGKIAISSNGYSMYGYKEGEIDPTIDFFYSTVHPIDLPIVQEAINDSLKGNNEYNVEFRARCGDGVERWFYCGGGAERDGSGAPIRMLGVMRDISDRKLREKERLDLEKQLFQAQKMEAVGQLAGGIAHDFNNMLSVILGSAEMVKEELEEIGNNEFGEYLDNIIISGTRASELTSQMLSLSRTRPTEARSIDPIPIVKDVVRMFQSTFPTSIGITLESYQDVPEIEANSVQLTQAVMNICINARDAIGERGSIKIGIHFREHVETTCSSCHRNFSGGYVEISISDTAGGIPSDIRDSIFNPFFTTKKVGEGTGMGLAMVHGIMHDHKGHVLLEIEEGVGTCFRLLFRAAIGQQPLYQVEEPIDWDAIISRPYRVLVVDDEAGVATTISNFLKRAGCSASVCTDSREAMRSIEEGGLESFDLMITDQTMPNVTGAELATRAMEINPNFPVILCTGFSAHLNERKSAELGIRKLLRKPVPRLELLKTVEEILSDRK